MQAEGQLARDVGRKEHPAGPQPARRARRAEPAERGGAELHQQERRHQGEVDRRPYQVQAERLAVQAERAGQAEVGVDEVRDTGSSRGEVALDRARDDRLAAAASSAMELGIGRRPDLDHGLEALWAQAATPSTRRAKPG